MTMMDDFVKKTEEGIKTLKETAEGIAFNVEKQAKMAGKKMEILRIQSERSGRSSPRSESTFMESTSWSARSSGGAAFERKDDIHFRDEARHRTNRNGDGVAANAQPSLRRSRRASRNRMGRYASPFARDGCTSKWLGFFRSADIHNGCLETKEGGFECSAHLRTNNCTSS